MLIARPGEYIDNGPLIPEVDFTGLDMRVSTDRYHSREYSERERERLWMRVWQIAGRADEIPEPGDWMLHAIFDQSYVLVRGRDGVVRGFVNACRHRGNAFCQGKSGQAARFTCPYHNWSYGLDGQLLAVAKPDYKGPVEEFVGSKEELGLLQVPVECFAGFIFMNPDPDAMPLADFLGEAADILAAYHLDEGVPVGMNVREAIHCNWKVVMDAFLEGYHVQAVHPELIAITDLARERFCRAGRHGATTVPFGPPGATEPNPESDVAMILGLPLPNFPGLVEVLPGFEKLVASYRRADGTLDFPEGVTARLLLQQATREVFTAKGFDASGLTDNQMSDYQFWYIFPNVYIQLHAGDATAIIARPHPDGDPNRCTWHVAHYIWLRPEEREEQRAPLVEVPEGEHFPYFLALDQDYRQMEDQQRGLRNRALKFMALTRQEPKVAHFHSVLDGWLAGEGAS